MLTFCSGMRGLDHRYHRPDRFERRVYTILDDGEREKRERAYRQSQFERGRLSERLAAEREAKRRAARECEAHKQELRDREARARADTKRAEKRLDDFLSGRKRRPGSRIDSESSSERERQSRADRNRPCLRCNTCRNCARCRPPSEDKPCKDCPVCRNCRLCWPSRTASPTSPAPSVVSEYESAEEGEPGSTPEVGPRPEPPRPLSPRGSVPVDWGEDYDRAIARGYDPRYDPLLFPPRARPSYTPSDRYARPSRPPRPAPDEEPDEQPNDDPDDRAYTPIGKVRRRLPRVSFSTSLSKVMFEYLALSADCEGQSRSYRSENIPRPPPRERQSMARSGSDAGEARQG